MIGRRIAILFVAVALSQGCSRQSDSDAQRVNARPSKAAAVQLPFQPVVTESVYKLQDDALSAEVRSLLDAKNFQALDELARKLRESKECFPAGPWKLDALYDALEPSEKAPDAEWLLHFRVLRDWIKARPQSITARVALADALTSYAWKARGGGYADTVTQRGWKLLEDRLNEAVSVFNDAKALEEKCPRLWTVILVAAKGLSWAPSKYDKYFREAVQFEPEYFSVYYEKATYLLPRWFGEPGDWEAFMTRAADARGGVEGDLLYARMVWGMHSGYYRKIFQECKVNWARCDRGFKVMIERFPDSLGAKSERAYLAGLGAGAQVARKRLEALDGKIDLSVWHTRENFLQFAQWAYSEP